MVKLREVEGGTTELFGDMSGEAFVVAESVQVSARAELYDSGCTNHISPYKSSFDNFQIIKTRHFRAANKQTFSTIGKGNLVIDVPNENCYGHFTFYIFIYTLTIHDHAITAWSLHVIIYLCLRCLNAASCFISLVHAASTQPYSQPQTFCIKTVETCTSSLARTLTTIST